MEGGLDDKRIERLEERFVRTEERVIQLDKSITVYSAIFERNLLIQEKLSAAIDKLSETTSGLQGTLIGVIQDIKRNSDAQESNSMRIGAIEEATDKRIGEVETKLHGKLKELEKELNNVDDKGKFDFIRFIRDNMISIVMFIYIVIDGIKEYLPIK